MRQNVSYPDRPASGPLPLVNAARGTILALTEIETMIAKLVDLDGRTLLAMGFAGHERDEACAEIDRSVVEEFGSDAWIVEREEQRSATGRLTVVSDVRVDGRRVAVLLETE